MATILIVVSSPTDRLFLAQLLAQHGHRTLAAAGANALALARAECPDLVIANLVGPTADDDVFAAQWRLESTSARSAVIVLAGPEAGAVRAASPWCRGPPARLAV